MTKEEFDKAWALLLAVFRRKYLRKAANLIFEEFFTKLNGEIFFKACKQACYEVEFFPSLAILFRIYGELRIQIHQPEYSSCLKCDDGYIHFKIVRFGTRYNYIARCNCEAGESHRELPEFEKSMGSVKEYAYCGEIFVVQITPREAKSLGVWKDLCKISTSPTDEIAAGEIDEHKRIFLTIVKANEIGLEVNHIMSTAKNDQKLMDAIKANKQKGIIGIIKRYLQSLKAGSLVKSIDDVIKPSAKNNYSV